MHTHHETTDVRTKRMPTGWVKAMFAAMAAFIVALPALGLDAKPKMIEFGTYDGVEIIRLEHNGQAVPASAIKSVKPYAGGHDYDHMITVEKADGSVTIQPTKLLEIGSYDLVIDTAYGKTTVSIMAPLDKLYTSLENRSARLGITVDELKYRLGLTQPLGEEHVHLDLPKVYYLGQTLTCPMERHDNRVYIWSVNGEIVEVGKGDTALNYTFTEPGIYDFSYVEKEGDRVVARGFGATTVVREPAVRLQVAVNTPMNFKAPDGYEHYVWEVDGVKQGLDKELTHDFTEKGSHVVTIHAHRPTSAAMQPLREVTYIVTAT